MGHDADVSRAAPLIAVTILALAACGGSDDPAGSPTTASSEPAPRVPEPAEATDSTAPDSTVAATTTPTTTTIPATTAVPATTTTPETAAPTTTSSPEPPASTSPVALPFEPIGFGPFEVGGTTITIDDPAGDRPLTVEVWFPLSPDADTGELPPHRYTLLPGAYYESPDALGADPALIATEGPFPLVVYSHGSGGLRYLHSAYTEMLASHGHVVTAPDHTGNTVIERITGAGADPGRLAVQRPDDVRRVIDALVDPDHPTAGPFARQVDPARIAVTGHSLGGFTAIALVAGLSTDVGEVPADDRIDAIIPLAPATGSQLVTDEVLADVDAPMMVIAGTNDTTTPIDPNVTRLWELTDNSPAYRVELVDGAHQTFTNLCEYADFLPTIGDGVPPIVVDTIEAVGEEGCSPGDIDDQRAHELTNTYALAFLDEMFRDAGPITFEPPPDVIFMAR